MSTLKSKITTTTENFILMLPKKEKKKFPNLQKKVCLTSIKRKEKNPFQNPKDFFFLITVTFMHKFMSNSKEILQQ